MSLNIRQKVLTNINQELAENVAFGCVAQNFSKVNSQRPTQLVQFSRPLFIEHALCGLVMYQRGRVQLNLFQSGRCHLLSA